MSKLPPVTKARERAVAELLGTIEAEGLRERVAFAHRHVVAKTGGWYDLTPPARRWVIDEYFGAVDGYKLWPRSLERPLCEWCAVRAMRVVALWIVESEEDIARHAEEHDGCPGLATEPISLTLINLPRQEGKTTNTMAYSLEVIFKERNKAVCFVAAAKDQTSRLFDESWRNAIESNPALASRCRIVGDTVHVPETNSRFWMVATSGASSTGSSATHVIFDEARDIPPEVFMALVPSMFARSGWECPIPGHYHIEGDTDRARCVCGKLLRPWFGRIIATSSSGVEKNEDRDWFGERVDAFLKDPQPNIHVYKRDESLNPAIDTRRKTALGRALETSPALRPYVMAEIYNQRTKPGEDFLTTSQLERVLKRLQNERALLDPCVSFLDASIAQDLTSLVILAPRTADWLGKVYTPHIRFWDPKLEPMGVIDDVAILRYLDELFLGFPGLRAFGIDTRGMPWAAKLLKTIKGSGRPWAARAESIAEWPKDAEDQGWQIFEEHALRQTIEVHDLDVIRKEIAGVRKRRRPDGSYKVEDRNRAQRHRDVTSSIACACWMAVREAAKREITLAQLEASRPLERLQKLKVNIPRIRGEEDL